MLDIYSFPYLEKTASKRVICLFRYFSRWRETKACSDGGVARVVFQKLGNAVFSLFSCHRWLAMKIDPFLLYMKNRKCLHTLTSGQEIETLTCPRRRSSLIWRMRCQSWPRSHHQIHEFFSYQNGPNDLSERPYLHNPYLYRPNLSKSSALSSI